MIDFNRKPSPKSKEEIRFEELNEQYTEKFGKPYSFPIGIDIMSWEEMLADISKRIETGEPQQEPEYNPDYVY